MKILILAPFCSLPGEPYFNRFLYLSEILSENQDVTLVTSNFRHFDKSFREPYSGTSDFKVVLLDESGYSKNVSIARLRSHHAFTSNFVKWFSTDRNGYEFDIVYSAFPLISTNIVLGKLKKIYGFKLIIDVQDIWPESFAAVLPFLDILPATWIPFSWRANRAYRSADALVAVSETYLSRAKLVNPRAPSLVTYIGSDFNFIESVECLRWPNEGVNFLYIGTLSHSYDLETVIKGMRKLQEQGKSWFFHILGDGPDLDRLKSIAPTNVIFHGFVSYEKMVALAKGSDIFVNPIKGSAKQSITNKLSDYMLIGKPIISSQTNPEAKQILNKANATHYVSGDVDGFISAAICAIEKKGVKNELQIDVKNLFARNFSYVQLCKFIESIR